MLIKSQTKTFHKVLYAEILCTPGVLNFGRVYIATVSILVFSTVIPVPRLGILQIGSRIPRHYAYVWLHCSGEGSSLPALIMVKLACNKHFSFKCVCVCMCM